MRALALVLVLSAPAYACDWKVSKRVDPMTDQVICTVSSQAAKVSFFRRGADRPNVVAGSAYSREGLTIRVDDNPAIHMGENAYDRQRALDVLLPQLEKGQRIRTQYRDYPVSQEGDAPICNLPQLLAECSSQSSPIEPKTPAR